MAKIDSIITQMQSLIDSANTATGGSDTTITDSVNTLIAGYGQGGSGSDLPEAEGASF